MFTDFSEPELRSRSLRCGWGDKPNSLYLLISETVKQKTKTTLAEMMKGAH